MSLVGRTRRRAVVGSAGVALVSSIGMTLGGGSGSTALDPGGGLSYPDWWAFVLLGLAAFRVWHLLALDTVVEPLRRRVYRIEDYDADDQPLGRDYRRGLDDFMGCPWCSGFWVSVVWFGAYVAAPSGAVWFAVPFALSAVVGLLARF